MLGFWGSWEGLGFRAQGLEFIEFNGSEGLKVYGVKRVQGSGCWGIGVGLSFVCSGSVFAGVFFRYYKLSCPRVYVEKCSRAFGSSNHIRCYSSFERLYPIGGYDPPLFRG